MVLAPRTSSLPKLMLKPGRWTVGSAATCSYRIAGDGVRPRHALVLCGGQASVLKAWDSKTWHNGHPVRGEVRLHPGDIVTIGSVEFSVQSPDSSDELATPSDNSRINHQHDAPASGSDLGVSDPSLARRAGKETASGKNSDTRPDGWDLELLRGQIQELRDELSQRVTRRTATIPISLNDDEVAKSSARVTELEESVAEARRLAEHAQQKLAADREEQARHEAELRQVADDLRPALEVAQQEVAELCRERELLRTEADQRSQAWEQQAAEWSAERDQWQEELVSSATARQQLATEFEQRQSETLDEVTRWKSECEQLRADWQLQQSAREDERGRWQDEMRNHEEAIQKLEADRQTLQGELNERAQAVAALTEEHQRVEQQAAQGSAKVEDLSRRLADFEQQQANFSREQQTLEHSWNWLQSDRRKLIEEKEAWQQQRAQWQVERESGVAEREQLQREREEFAKSCELWHAQHAATQQLSADREVLAAEWQQLRVEQAACASQREQFETERRTRDEEWEAACVELHAQQQALHDERTQAQELCAELVARAADFEHERQTVEADEVVTAQDLPAWEVEQGSWRGSDRDAADDNWKNNPAAPSLTPIADSVSAEAAMTDDWNIGVDLTAPRESCVVERVAESPIEPDSPPQLGDAWETPTESVPASNTNPEDMFDSDPTALPDHRAESDSSDPSQDVSEFTTTHETVNNSSAEEVTIVPTVGPVVSILESMAFADDEDVDDSVSRYMQHLLARSQNPVDDDRDRYVPVPTGKSSTVVAAVAKPFDKKTTADGWNPNEPAVTSGISPELSPPASDSLSSDDSIPSQQVPIHRQDRDALRAATEQMRQVANQQTVKNVEAANWKQIRRSIKTKLALAALSFVLSAGLLFWGYHYRPEFLILGILASGLGVVTWLDLLLAIRQAHVRASKLTGRKKPSVKAKS